MEYERRGGRGDRTGRYGGGPCPPRRRLPHPAGSRLSRHGTIVATGAPPRGPPPLGPPLRPPTRAQSPPGSGTPPRPPRHCPSVPMVTTGTRITVRKRLRRSRGPAPSSCSVCCPRPPPKMTSGRSCRRRGCSHREVRLMRNKSSGQSRGFAFVEFNHVQDAARWMDANQQQGLSLVGDNASPSTTATPSPKLMRTGSVPSAGCRTSNRREKVLQVRCPQSRGGAAGPWGATAGTGTRWGGAAAPPPTLWPHPGGGTQWDPKWDRAPELITPTTPSSCGNLHPQSSLGLHLGLPSPPSPPSRLPTSASSKTARPQLTRGFAFVQLATIVEASQLLQMLQALHPPLHIDGKSINVEFAKGSKREVQGAGPGEGPPRASAASVASTAIAAAQWALSQAAPGGETTWAGGEEPPSDFSSFYQSEETFAGPTPALYGSAYLKGAAAPPPGPALSGPAPAKADGPRPR
ncbi:RNA-binding protein 10-like [Aquila chrysaetos chrysaetos]|uniref:RNA-binding protein 10-like n=1 Tax=Aquila chrysaetos chrysaetos TaxID=223781 RepID=UPI001176FA2B|nr:RNA-binding protein 10-like [Aquila chrysaetos chrysaetos]